jgi:hypothetical protein
METIAPWTEAQRLAIERPCTYAEDTLRPGFRRIMSYMGTVFSVILTVNK